LSTAILGFANTLCFQFQIEDLPLKYRILWEDFKNKITGRKSGKDEGLYRAYEIR
jgi:hypothetical protein